LRDLQKLGVTILPTVLLTKTNHLNLTELIPSHWKRAVIKPAFSAGSYLTEVFDVSKLNNQ
jgi:hypothetical protein